MIEQSLTPADDLLDQWPHLRKSQRRQAFQKLPREYTDDFFLSLDASAQAELLLALPKGERRLFVPLLAPDDAADLIQESSKNERESLMGLMDDVTRRENEGAVGLSRGRCRRVDESPVRAAWPRGDDRGGHYLPATAAEPSGDDLLRVRVQ